MRTTGCKLKYPTGDLDVLSRLETLKLPNCHLGGDSGPLLRELRNVRHLNLRRNTLSQGLEHLPRLTKLVNLNLSRCGIRGIWPPDANASLVHLERLDLSRNAFRGEAPDGSHMPRLKTYSVAWNGFTSPDLAALCASLPRRLVALDLSGNGSFPRATQPTAQRPPSASTIYEARRLVWTANGLRSATSGTTASAR